MTRGYPLLIFVVIWTFTFHFLLSPYGFNPTDDGDFLALAQRLANHQWPHRDFVSQYAVLSGLVHLPELWLGQESSLLVSRFVACCEWSSIAYLWTKMMAQIFDPVSSFIQICLFIISFAFNFHNFPIMAWPTVDGIFFYTLGLFLVSKPGYLRYPGFFFAGCCPLFKQSFLLAPLLMPFLTNHWREGRVWAALLMPVTIYCVAMYGAGAFELMIAQSFVHGDSLMKMGVWQYLNNPSFRLCALVLSAALILPWRWCTWSTQVVIGIYSLFTFTQTANDVWLLDKSFALAAMWVGGLMWLVRLKEVKPVRLYVLAMVLAWSASISLGYNSLGLMSGVLITFYLVILLRTRPVCNSCNLEYLALASCASFALICFAYQRIYQIYREPPIWQVTYPLKDVLPAGKGIFTHRETYEYLTDLRHQADLIRQSGKQVAVLPDTAGFWVNYEQANPLANDWPQRDRVSAEISTQMLEQSLRDAKSKTVILLSKVHPRTLHYEPYADDYLIKRYPIVAYLHSHFVVVGESQFFVFYE